MCSESNTLTTRTKFNGLRCITMATGNISRIDTDIQHISIKKEKQIGKGQKYL